MPFGNYISLQLQTSRQIVLRRRALVIACAAAIAVELIEQRRREAANVDKRYVSMLNDIEFITYNIVMS